jgi:CheY-like chemotaxis protein
MAFINFDSADHRLQDRSGWQSVVQKIVAWVNGETVTHRPSSLLHDDMFAGSDSFDLITPHLISDRDILVVEEGFGPLYGSVKSVATAALSVSRFDNFERAFNSALSRRTSATLLVVDIDMFADMAEAVERLLALKQALPQVPVVICSTTFSTNNFSLQRRAIADASLRLPSCDVTLALAIESGIQNSQITA